MTGVETNLRNPSSADMADGQQLPNIHSGRNSVSDQKHPSTASTADSKKGDPVAGGIQYEGEAGREVELMMAYKAGDRAAFEKLYRMYQPKLYRFFLSATGSEAVALDLYQETWTKVIRARDRYTPRARFSTWIFAIARNCLNDFYRIANKPINKSLGADEAESAIDQISADESDTMLAPDEIASMAERAEFLQQALKLLPDEQKDVVLLRYAAGMSVAEIAVMNEENPETVKSRLRYALPRLRSSLRLLERGL